MKIKLRNRLDVLMRDSDVRSVEEMSQRLTENQGYKITRTPLSRKFKDEDVTLSLTLIEAICNELQCLPGDLFETEITDATTEYVDELRSRLQPFRYGTIRLRQPGALSPDETAIHQEEAKAEVVAKQSTKPHKASKIGSNDELDDIAGPKVTHMHVGSLKKT